MDNLLGLTAPAPLSLTALAVNAVSSGETAHWGDRT